MTWWGMRQAPAGSRAASTGWAARLAVAATAAFVLLQLPLLGDPTWRHADEHHYTDAAVRMLADGDVATPRAADGTPRFHKPLLTYWAIAASFRAFGVGIAASRLPSLLAVVLLAWLAWRTALVWLDDRVLALLAVVILLAHPETAQLATRATPDALLVCFVTASLLGISRLATAATPPPRAAVLAWTGAGLGVATKGLPGLLCIAYGLVTLRRDGRSRWLLRPAAMALGAGLAMAGTAPAWLEHGTAAVTGLHADQVGTRRIVRAFDAAVRSAGHEIGSMALAFLPWTALLALRGRATVAAARRAAAVTRFTLGWTALLLLLSTLLAFRRPRYVAPAIPLLAVTCAGLVAGVARRLRPAAAIAPAATLLALGLGWMLAGGLFRAVVRPALCESAAPELMACLDAAGADGAGAVAVGDTASHVASDLRLVSRGRLDLASVRGPRALAQHEPSPPMIVAGGDVAPTLEQQGWLLRPCGREVRFRWTLREVLDLARTRDRQRLLAARARTVFVATPRVP